MPNDVAVIIPARYASSRFPGKPLALIGSKPMIYYVYKACKLLASKPKVVIATDDDRIYSACKDFVEKEFEVVMTPTNINTGSERCAFVASSLNVKYVVNLQGDEPLISSDLLEMFINDLSLLDVKTPKLTLAKKRFLPAQQKMFLDRNTVKLIMNKNNEAVYFSRAAIPYSKNNPPYFYQHVGIYGYLKDFLIDYTKMPQGFYEAQEGLEQLRVIENGYAIKVRETDAEFIGVDTPEDIKIVKSILKEKGKLL